SRHKCNENQLHIEHNDNASYRPAQNFQPKPIGKLAHLRFFVGKTHQWPNGETELHAQDDLAGDQQLGGFAFAKNADYEDGRNNRQGSGDQPAQPRSDPKVQKTFHYNLASEGAGESRILSRSEERHREKNARDSHAEQRTGQLISILNFRDILMPGSTEND